MEYVSSHALLSTNACISPSFEKHTTGVGSLMLRKMGYAGGGLGKNGQVIVVPIHPKLQTSRVSIEYDVVVTSVSSPGLHESKNIVLVTGRIQSEEQLVDECVDKLAIPNKPEI